MKPTKRIKPIKLFSYVPMLAMLSYTAQMVMTMSEL